MKGSITDGFRANRLFPLYERVRKGTTAEAEAEAGAGRTANRRTEIKTDLVGQ